jgi:hypothetical protein
MSIFGYFKILNKYLVLIFIFTFYAFYSFFYYLFTYLFIYYLFVYLFIIPIINLWIYFAIFIYKY